MLSPELTKKVKLIEITTKKIMNELITGQYRSHFKGHGMQFSEHRQYNIGDDVRHIDWKVSARTHSPMLKKFEEERELTVLILVDVSRSEHFGSGEKLKAEVTAEVGGMLAYAAVQTGDRVGVLFFSSEVEKIIPPKKGKGHVLRVIRDLLTFETKFQGTRISQALKSARQLMKHSGVIFIMSDFIDEGYEQELKRLAKKNDVVAIWIQDQRELEIPSLGYLNFENLESGEQGFIHTGSFAFQRWLKETMSVRNQKIENELKTSKVEILKIQTNEDYGQSVVDFFLKRKMRKK